MFFSFFCKHWVTKSAPISKMGDLVHIVLHTIHCFSYILFSFCIITEKLQENAINKNFDFVIIVIQLFKSLEIGSQ